MKQVVSSLKPPFLFSALRKVFKQVPGHQDQYFTLMKKLQRFFLSF